MSGWGALRTTYWELRVAAAKGAPLAEVWARFGDQAQTVAGRAPEHLSLLIDLVRKKCGDQDPANVAILDHGCGSGLTMLVMAALGFTNIYGVDIGGDLSALNRICRKVFGHDSDRFRVYDGDALPLPDASIDIVLSQQVLEHVRPAVLESYYREESRVLKQTGIAYHQVPHRLVPYESHTRTWFLHYLPRPIFIALLQLIRSDVPVIESHLYLRWPWRHKKLVRRFIGPYRDLTLDRLKMIRKFETYDGPRGLRRLINRTIDLPVIGGALGAAIIWFVQIDTVTVKQGGPYTKAQ
jgi:SAM-dependent methyltransferase|tara:strand:- start:1778 stop:2665 length:888 start_codon:yes stop_codon:yes gene_type:complete